MRRSSANTMKPSRPSQPGSLQRDESATSIDTNVSKSRENEGTTPQGSTDGGRLPSPRVLHGKITATNLQDAAALDLMRKRMSEALAQKQQQRTGGTPPVPSPKSATTLMDSSAVEGAQNAPSVGLSTLSGTISTDSAGTVRATPMENTSGRVRTPSYPFPRMQSRLERGVSQRSEPHHRPFTLLSPTNEPLETQRSEDASGYYNASELSTPIGRQPTDLTLGNDPDYPTPDLYDMVLMLSTEPGLESWWANVTEVLTEAYGAERASLALPGDITDLENVPWGQKATYNIYGSENGESVVFGSNTASEVDARLLERVHESLDRSQELRTSVARPPLETRHSIAGITPDRATQGLTGRPEGPTRAVSFMPGHSVEREATPPQPRLARQSSTAQSIARSEHKESPRIGPDYSASLSSMPRCHVWRSLLPLEAESDALLVRTGVASLFGKRKPIVLTRAYSGEQMPSSISSSIDSDDEKSPVENPKDEKWQSYRTRNVGAGSMRAFDEFEQPEPSPWAQSPSPSPAARPDPDESPFFNQAATVDETAFERDPPIYDYGATANQSLNAIGIDMSKTLIHIPLIQPVPSRSVVSAGLRFPVAILSFLSPITPYPRNLRHSLGSLLPHLASTFSLAQQFSVLQERTRTDSMRRSATFGLGGTFSDEGSEIELLSELSSQLVQEKDRSRNPSLHGSIYSPSEAASKGSTSGSVVGTPYLDQFGLNAGNPATPSRLGTDMVDSYFSAKRHRGSGIAQTPGARQISDSVADSGRKTEKAQKSRTSARKSMSQSVPLGDSLNSGVSRLGSSQKASNSTSDSDRLDSGISGSHEQADCQQQKSFSHRDSVVKIDSEKPLPELISSLMLNAVPLQLFLAKPTTGDLVWTNRKFDAFRSQGEGRVRDPWKNVHSADQGGLIKSWKEALNAGTQFTHYVRVKRFNSDSDFRWFVFRASTLLSNSGRLLYWIGSFLDVHEQYIKSLEASEKEATRSRDAKLRALADAIPQILFEAVEGEGIVSVNQQWHIFAGQTLEEARGLGFARHVHKDDLPKCGILSQKDYKPQPGRSPIEATSSPSSAKATLPNPSGAPARSMFTPDSDSLHMMLQQGALVAETDEDGRTSYSTEIRLRSKGGEFRWHLVRLVKVQHELLNGGRASWYGTCTDIEARMGLERDLNQANQKVNQEMESKTKFFANMSHEIRTPLNGILGSMPWLVESQLDHDQRRTVDTVQNSANNLRELVDNILDVTKVEAGKMTLLPKWFHVRSLCEEVVDTVSSRAIERGLELNYSLDSDVPTMVKGDPFRVRQVLLNLMGNSVKFTQQGEIYLRCSLHKPPNQTLEPDEAYLKFDVTDTGRGFNETEFKRLFKQFGQIDGANQHESGSGLGLFLSKQLVEMHGGELSVRSKTGEGSTFSFYIKVEPPHAQTEAISPISQERPPHRHSMSMTSSTRSNSDSKTPTISASKSVVHTPGVSKYASPEFGSPVVLSPAVMSSPVTSPISSAASMRSNSGTILQTSSISSLIPTPESGPTQAKFMSYPNRPPIPEITESTVPTFKRSKSDNDGRGLAPEISRPELYSIVVICPAEHARTAIKQHIEHVVPHQIPAHVTTLKDIGAFMDLMHGPNSPTFTHIVLNLPASSDIMLFMRQMVNFTVPVLPVLVVVTDHHQKRDIQEDFTLLVTSGRKAFLVHKPVKPSVFATIFDPAQVRKLSKDRAREVAQTSSDDFRRVSNLVKETIGHRSFRILLVEDSDVNRMVIMRYLKRVGLTTEEARDGQECVDKVISKPAGYYSLIICDIQMPRKNGYEACTEVRGWETKSGLPPCPIMALTANAMPEERAAAGSAGFTDYLTKPVDFNRLGLMMVTLLDKDTPHVLLRDQPTEEGLPNARRG